MKEICEAKNCKREAYASLETTDGIKMVCAKHYYIGLSTDFDKRIRMLRQ